MNYYEPLRVLYVEDNCDSFEMLKVMLGLSSIDVECATTVGEGLRRAGAEKFDLYLLDSGLPDGNGFALCRTLRAADPKIPVLFYSGHVRPEDIERGMASGASGYVTKPNSEQLVSTIIQVVTNYRERRRPAFTGSRVLSAAA